MEALSSPFLWISILIAVALAYLAIKAVKSPPSHYDQKNPKKYEDDDKTVAERPGRTIDSLYE